MLLRFLLAATAACAFTQSAGAATFTPVSSLGSGVTFATLPGATGTVYAPGTPVVAGFATLLSASNPLERNDQASYIDSNFGPTTQFINQCGYTGLGTCVISGAITISFAQPVAGFTVSADDFDTTARYTFTARAYNGSSLLGTVTASSLADNGSSPAILAALSSIAITSVVISDPTGNFALANIGVVPEPASVALLVTGVLAVAGLRRRASTGKNLSALQACRETTSTLFVKQAA